MSTYTHSVVRSIELFDRNDIKIYRRDGETAVRIINLSDSLNPALLMIPGSGRVETKKKDGLVTITISFSLPHPTPDDFERLRMLEGVQFIVRYIDEWGRHRVAGSKDWPLWLTVSEDAGQLIATLTGQSLWLPMLEAWPV